MAWGEQLLDASSAWSWWGLCARVMREVRDLSCPPRGLRSPGLNLPVGMSQGPESRELFTGPDLDAVLVRS